jgi:L-histidine N-alpha-methyltransferase
MSAQPTPAFTAPALDPLPPILSERFALDVLEGLSRPRKSIPCTWLYDARGSALFEAITELPEYHPTRTEIALLGSCAAAIAAHAGPRPVVLELGSGSSRKTPLLLRALAQPAAYVPIDISPGMLHDSVQALRPHFPALPCLPVVGDFSTLAALPDLPEGTRLGFFPGSTLGNFAPSAATGLLRHWGELLGPGSLMVVGIDATCDPEVLVPAYDDAQGVTAAFNLNLLTRINRELGADFQLTRFRHEARFASDPTRIEMHLVSRMPQQVTIGGHAFRFQAGESIHTESSHKYGDAPFKALARAAGWSPVAAWSDAARCFAVHLLRREGPA